MRIAVFTDIHHNDQNIAQRHCVSAIPLLRETFNRLANPAIRPDMMISLGDLIMASRSSSTQECLQRDARNLDEILGCFAQSGLSPVHHIHGNHEDKNLSRTDVAAIAQRHGMDFSSRLIEQDGLSLVLWSPGTRIAAETKGAVAVPAKDLQWLKTTLSQVRHPAIVLTHLPVDGDLTDFQKSSFDGKPNPVFGKKARTFNYYATHYPNAPQIRDIIAASGNVVACLAGHTHWNEARMQDNVAYITLPSLVEDANNQPHKGWALLESDSQNKAIHIMVQGAAPCRYRISTDKANKSFDIQQLSAP